MIYYVKGQYTCFVQTTIIKNVPINRIGHRKANNCKVLDGKTKFDTKFIGTLESTKKTAGAAIRYSWRVAEVPETKFSTKLSLNLGARVLNLVLNLVRDTSTRVVVNTKGRIHGRIPGLPL